ncbi:hypothetical protein Mgra_00007015 [Meloidogyne graminicola]|uniref:Apple domain-containing protein n=1 Tax=Meloidogyne graminicola TaxID=189291 RepID=A0A8S9ZJS9_9BILA|nr:hypothetical protein Mgra_00007015 [Meloidogyne graminicola]
MFLYCNKIMDSIDACANYCLENIIDLSQNKFICHGFTREELNNLKKENICEFFDENKAEILERKPLIQKNEIRQSKANLNNYYGKNEKKNIKRNYFERICLSTKNSTLLVKRLIYKGVYPHSSFSKNIENIKIIEIMEDRKYCLEECLSDNRCRSVDFDTKNGNCYLFAYTIYSTLGTQLPFIKQLKPNVDIDHYENMCKIKENFNRCGNRHLAFILTKDVEVHSFGVVISDKISLTDCLTKCLESPFSLCQAVQYRHSIGECIHLMEKIINEPLPNDEIFLFEPICLPDPPNNLTTLDCLEEHVFEKVQNMELKSEQLIGGDIKEFIGIKLEDCLDACILEENCLSINFRFVEELINETNIKNISSTFFSTICQILPFNRSDINKTLTVLIQGIDYYELACNRENIKENFKNKEINNEIIKLENKTEIELKIEKSEEIKDLKTTIIPSTSTNKIKCSFLPNSGIQECINIETTTQIIFPTLITKIQQKLIKDFPINLENIPKQITIKENLTEIMSTTNNIFLNSSTEEYLSTEELNKSTIQTNIPETKLLNNNCIYSNQVQASVFCDSQGANVTFKLIDPSISYTGKIYAADHLTNCFLNIKNSKEFFFFVNKPKKGNNFIKNWCNVQENNNQLNVLLVLSNSIGEGTPPELTTKNDLFFYVTCRYVNGIPIPEGNVTINGATPLEPDSPQTFNKLKDEQQNIEHFRNNEDTRIKLKILRNGKPINNVFIGEKLLAVVESNKIKADNFLNQFLLLDINGCSIYPQIMGNMRRVNNHLEAELTAFRIDGGSELDIICSVIVCHSNCKTEKCSNNKLEESSLHFNEENNFKSTEFLNNSFTNQHPRLERMTMEQIKNDKINEENNKILVDKRIKVLVMKEIDENNLNEEEKEEKEIEWIIEENNNLGNKIVDEDYFIDKNINNNELITQNYIEEEEKDEENNCIIEPFIILFSAAILLILSGSIFAIIIINWLQIIYTHQSINELVNGYFYIPRIRKDFNPYIA